MAILQKGKAWMIQLLSVACLSLAAKMEETEVPLLLDLQVMEFNSIDINLIHTDTAKTHISAPNEYISQLKLTENTLKLLKLMVVSSKSNSSPLN